MENKHTKLFPNYVIKKCTNEKCGRIECHSITTEKRSEGMLFVTVVKCLACGNSIEINFVKGGK